jgi:hypothetical protein
MLVLRLCFLAHLKCSFLKGFCREGIFGLGEAGFGFNPNLAEAAFNFSKTSLLIQRIFLNSPLQGRG